MEQENANDIWGLIEDQVEQGWFVPSKEEWSAFAGELGITKTNYTGYRLHSRYWSSSHFSVGNAFYADFSYGFMTYHNMTNLNHVRLSRTF